MSFALTLLVLLSPGDEAMAPALAAAARATLTSSAALELRVVAQPLDDAGALALASSAQARAVAMIAFDAGRRHARVRLYDVQSSRWLERDLEFGSDDAVDEQARAIGFTLGSMLPDAEPPALAERQPPAPASSSPPAMDSQPPAPPNAGVSTHATAAPRVESPGGPAHAPTAVPTWTFALDAAAQGTLAIGGDGSAVGGELGGRYRLGDHLALCLAAALRVGHLEALEASAIAVDFGPGLGWRSADPAPGQRWAFGLRLDTFARLQSVRRDGGEGRTPEAHGRVVPGIGLQLEALYALTPSLTLFADTGAHALLGETEVRLRGEQVASLAPAELVLALGASAEF